MLGKILGGLAAIIAIVIALGFVLPDRVTMERAAVINAPQDEVFALVGDFNQWSRWSPWAETDPNAQYAITGAGVGHRMEWTSEHPEVGNGAQEITEFDAPNVMGARLDFGDMGQANAKFSLSPEGESTKVVWSFESNMREGVPFYMQPMSTYMGYFMEGMLGPSYEQGLANLKEVAEEAQ